MSKKPTDDVPVELKVAAGAKAAAVTLAATAIGGPVAGAATAAALHGGFKAVKDKVDRDIEEIERREKK